MSEGYPSRVSAPIWQLCVVSPMSSETAHFFKPISLSLLWKKAIGRDLQDRLLISRKLRELLFFSWGPTRRAIWNWPRHKLLNKEGIQIPRRRTGGSRRLPLAYYLLYHRLSLIFQCHRGSDKDQNHKVRSIWSNWPVTVIAQPLYKSGGP